jgi:hypothetical protein
MGILNSTDWKGAKWIGYERLPDSLYINTGFADRGPKGLSPVKDIMPVLRKKFSVNNPLKKQRCLFAVLANLN